jgi:chorismate mutase
MKHERMSGLKTLAPIVLIVILTLNCDARAQQPGKSLAPSPAWNDNPLITVQKRQERNSITQAIGN